MPPPSRSVRGNHDLEPHRRRDSETPARLGTLRHDRHRLDALDNGTHASCGTVVTGIAVMRAAADARDQVLEFAAERLGCTAAELVLDNWTVRRDNYVHPLEPMIAEHYGGAGFEFVGCGMVKVPNDPKAPLNAASLFWMPSWVGAEVEVDRETGKVQVVHLVVGADSGRSVNAVACRGQVEGAALQAFGQSFSRSCATTAPRRRMQRRSPTACRSPVTCRIATSRSSSSMAAPAR